MYYEKCERCGILFELESEAGNPCCPECSDMYEGLKNGDGKLHNDEEEGRCFICADYKLFCRC